MFEKDIPFRSKKLMKAAKDCPACMNCGIPNDGTIVGAHYSGFRQYEFGKGVGQKCTDSAVAYLCMKCHMKMDNYLNENNSERSEQFLFAVVKSHDWLFKQGIVK